MNNKKQYTKNTIIILSWVSILGILYVLSLYSYLLFHSLSELFSIILACGIFMVAWNSRRFLENWMQIESYIHDHSEAQFSHGICPDCLRKYYPDLELHDKD